MAKITRFEDLEAWKTARRLTNGIYDVSEIGPFSKDFALRDQMRRAALSVLSNIAEGFERGGDKEFFHFLSQAKGSAGEFRAQCYIALDRKYLTAAQFENLTSQATETTRMICGLMNYLRRSDFRGSKYNNRHETSKD